jgi:hypothetical protein
MNIPGGLFEDVCVLPDTDQDDVYVIVNRGGQRYHMRMGKEESQESVNSCTLLDYYKVLTGSISSITGATHLASTTVQVWTDGVRHADVTLDGSGVGALTGGPFARVVYGLNYDAEFTSVKPAYAAQLGSSIGQEKIIRNLGLVLSNSCLDGIVVGTKLGSKPLRTGPLPGNIDGHVRTANQFYEHLDLSPFPMEGAYDADSRFYISASSQEGPVTIQSVVIDVEANETFTPRG